MSRSKKIISAAAGTLAVLLIFSATILPVIVKHKAVSAIEQETGRKVQIESLYINPLTLTVRVNGFALGDDHGGKLVSLKQLKASLSLASLYKRALILSEISLDTPAIVLQRLSAHTYNFNDILERQKSKPKKEAGTPLLFSLNNISIANGSVDFDDQAVPGGKKHSIRNLDITLPFISNIPYLIDKYTDPSITASINGAPFSFKGKVKPLSKSMETSVHIDLKQLNLPEYLAYVPMPPPVTLSSGTLAIDCEVTYRVSKDKRPDLGVTGLVTLDNLAIAYKDTQPLLRLDRLQARPADLDAFARRFSFASITLDGLVLHANRNQRGEWRHNLLMAGSSSAPAAATPTAPQPQSGAAPPPTQLKIAEFKLTNSSLHFSDDQPKGGFRTTISDIDANLRAFDNLSDTAAPYDLSLLIDNEAEFSLEGALQPASQTLTAQAGLNNLNLKRGGPYLARFLRSPVSGSLDLSASLEFSRPTGVTVKNGTLDLKNLAVRYGEKDKEGFNLSTLSIKGASFVQKDNRIEIDDIRLSRGGVSLSRGTDGSISPLALLVRPTAPTVARPEPPAAKTVTTPAAHPLSYRVNNFRLDRFDISFTDRLQEDETHITLKNNTLSLANISGPKPAPIKLSYSAMVNGNAPVKLSGSLTPQPFRYKGDISVGRLPIRDFENYIPDSVNVFVIGGTVDTAMNVDIALKDGKPSGSFKGSAGVRAFHTIDAEAEEDLLKWESLQLDEIQGSLQPFVLSIHQVALNNVYSRIVVRKDGTLNLQNLVDKPAEAPATTVTAAAAATSAPPVTTGPPLTAAQPRPAITIGAVTIQDGTLSFTDRHLPQNFKSTFYNLGGRVTGLSSEESRLADVDLRGNLENHSPLQITGKINPLKQDLFVDLKVSFKDIDLSPVTPYSGTYLGYTVDKGKLFLDLKYLIDKKQLNSENRVFIDQFTFGRQVESEKATKLPVRLAVALLKDRQGEIHLDLPVTGRTDDPKFSIWGVVWQVFRNLIVKAATSPFGLLSSMFGNGQDFSSVSFATGTSRISAAEEKKLLALAKILADRPGIKMEIKGYVDREKDAEGYRRELLERKLRNEKFLALAKERQTKEGQSAETTALLPEDYSKYLGQVYKKEKFPKPRNALGLVKSLPDDEMRKLIIANTVVGENEFQSLARERAATVMDMLVSKGQLPSERLFQKIDDIHKKPENAATARSRVEFNAIAQ